MQGVVDRFGQIGPRVLFCADGYLFAGKQVDSLGEVRAILERLPTVKRVVAVPYPGGSPISPVVRGAVALDEFIAPFDAAAIEFAPVEFDTRSTSSIPRAPPACPSASCTAPAARCCST